MPSFEFTNQKPNSIGDFEDDIEEEEFGSSDSLLKLEVSIPEPICLKKEEWISVSLRKCTAICNFKTDPMYEIEVKLQCLEDLLEYFQSNPAPMSRRRYAELFEMFSMNLFRKIPQNKKRNYDPEDENHTLELAWPHLKLVYEIFKTILEMETLRLDYTKIYMNDKFLHEFLELMDSDDPREKEMSKKVLHRIYFRFCTTRPYLRRELTNILLKFIYEAEYFSGVNEILEICSCIIAGLRRPISEEFVVFHSRVLVPLHKVKNLSVFHRYLTICLVTFLKKDTSFFKPIVEGLIKYWPKTNSPKEVLFLNEVEELLEAVDEEGFTTVHLQLFGQISKCVLSSHFQVVERSLAIFNNPSAWRLVERHHTELLPVLLPSLLRRTNGHWNQTVAVYVVNLLRKFKAIDVDFYSRSVQDLVYPPSNGTPKKMKKIHKKKGRIYDLELSEVEFEEEVRAEDLCSDDFSPPPTDPPMSGRGDDLYSRLKT